MKNTNTTSLSAAINRTMADSSVARCEYHRIYGVPWAPLPVQAVALIDAIDERGESLLLEIVEMRGDDATLAISDGIETRRVAALSLDTCAASPRSMRTANQVWPLVLAGLPTLCAGVLIPCLLALWLVAHGATGDWPDHERRAVRRPLPARCAARWSQGEQGRALRAWH